jgi:hypothetical protein
MIEARKHRGAPGLDGVLAGADSGASDPAHERWFVSFAGGAFMNNITGTTPNIGAMPAGTVRDDRVFPEIRVIAAVIVAVLAVAFVILYFLPDRTGDFFAWPIKPNMTPMLMGAGYISGAWFFVRAIFAPRWHWFGNGFLAITTFVWFMGLATFLHFDKFTPGHISFYAWLFLYVITPFLIPFLWYRNRATDPGTPDPGDVVVPPMLRQLDGVVGAGMLLIAVALFLLPFLGTEALKIWPWTVTPLTMRVIGGWFALPGVVGLVLAREPRWSGWRIMIESQVIALGLILLATVINWNLFDTGNPLTWVFVVGLSLLLIAVVALYITMELRRRAASAALVPAA